MPTKLDPENIEDVRTFLRDDLSYCNCASSLVLDLLYLTLAFARDIPNSPNKIQKSDVYPLGFGEWFIYFLENKGLIWHGFNSSDFAINPLGRQLLHGLERFGDELGVSEAILNNLADAYLNMALYDRAQHTIAAFIQKFPQADIGYHTQAEILFALGQHEGALVSIKKSITLADSEDKQALKQAIEEHC